MRAYWITGLVVVCLAVTAGCTTMGAGSNPSMSDAAASADGSHVSFDGGWGGWSDGGVAQGDAGSSGSNINLGGAEDFGYFRRLLDEGIVPKVGDFDAAGFFAEHYLSLPPPDCGTRVCLHAMLGVMADLLEGGNMTVLQLGLNTPITLDPDTRPPLSLAVVIDRSGSMADAGKIEYVKLGLQKLIDALEDTDAMALITYSDTARLDVPMSSLATSRAQFAAASPAIIKKSFVMLNLYQAIERACGDFHAGQGTAGIALLMRAKAAAADYNLTAEGGAGDLDMTYDVELLQQLIDVMVQNGATPPDSVDIPADPWPAD